MMQADNPPRRETTTENIDLLVLAERSLLFFGRYRWLFIIAILLGLTTGFIFYRIIPKTYKSRLIVHSYFLPNPEHIQIVRAWNQQLSENEVSVLAEMLNTDKKILSRVKWIKANEIQQVFSQQNPNGFVVDVLVTDTSILDEMQVALVFGFENNPYIKERLGFRRVALQELVDKTRQEIKKLDSTKKKLEGIIGGTERISAPVLIDASSVNTQLIEMNEKLMGLEENLKYTNAVQVLQGFTKFSKPDGPKLIPWLIMGLLGFLAIAYVIALFISIRRGLRERAIQRNA
jgi:hypothetical protein